MKKVLYSRSDCLKYDIKMLKRKDSMREKCFIRSYNGDELNQETEGLMIIYVVYKEDEDGKGFVVACLAS